MVPTAHGERDDRGAAHHHDGAHGHSHALDPDADRRYLIIALALTATFLVVEVAVGFAVHSLALLSDGGHLLTDVAALAAGLWAIRLAARPASGNWTFGWKRAEILSAAVNGLTLLIIAALVCLEAVRRLISPPEVQGGAVLVVALAGVAVNVLTTWVLSRANRASLNVEGAFQHIVTDLYAFIATVLAGAVVLLTGFDRADPIASLVVVALLLRSGIALVKASGRVLLEAAPEGVDLAEIRAHLLRAEHVLDVHDLHVWTVTSSLPAISAHVVLESGCFSDGHVPRLLDELQGCLGEHFDVEHSTFQFEEAAHAQHEHPHHA